MRDILGAWSEHRQVYGYRLRAELVYQLKQALEQRGDFKFGQPLKLVVIDEYQDLNRCDLAVIQQIETRGVELFVAGDDDQSIYEISQGTLLKEYAGLLADGSCES